MGRFFKTLWVPLACVVTGCGTGYSGHGEVRMRNQATACDLTVTVDGEQSVQVAGGREVQWQVEAGGHELKFEARAECFIYTNQRGSPFDSGRDLCNVVVDQDQQVSLTATGQDRGNFQQVNVECPGDGWAP